MKTIINERARQYLTYTCIAAAPLWLLWIIFDFVFAPDQAHLFLPLRITGSLISLIILLALKQKWGSVSLIQATMFAYYNAAIIYMLLNVDKEVLDIYFNGYSMVMIVMFFILVLKWIDLILFALIVVISFSSIFVFGNQTPYDIFGHGGFMFLTILTLMFFIGVLRYKGILMDVRLSRDIEKANEIQKMNVVLENANKEKEVLLKEIHHRVKNNLQVTSSILSLQLNHISKNQEATSILRESQHRIKTMSAIHETLYKSSNFSSIDFLEYLNNLLADTIEVFKKDCSVELQISPTSEKIHLSIDQSLPCGLIINELATNAMKYAFLNQKEGIISLSLIKINDFVKLTISDNGIGLPENFDFKNTETLGLELVNILIEQLDGEINVTSSKGTTFNISFPYIQSSEKQN